MRDLLGLDGGFINAPIPGQFLTTVSVDPNNGIYTLAYCIAETEDTESWTWFLEQLAEDLNPKCNSNFTFTSDRQKILFSILILYIVILKKTTVVY